MPGVSDQWPPSFTPPPGWHPHRGSPWATALLIVAVAVGAALIVWGFLMVGAESSNHQACGAVSVQELAGHTCEVSNMLFYGGAAAIVVGFLAALGGILGLLFRRRR